LAFPSHDPQPAFILVKTIDHMKILLNECTKQGVKAKTLCGPDDEIKRQSVLGELKQGKIEVIVTTLFDEGFDYPDLRTVVIAAGGKSRVKAIQRIGRGLRTAPGKDKAIIIDFFDQSSRTLKSHSRERIDTYKNQGYEVPHIW